MKKVLIFILSFILIPSITMAAKCINEDGSNGCFNVNSNSATNFYSSLSNGETITLQSDIDSFTFESTDDALNITIDLNGHVIDNMILYGSYQSYSNTSGSWWMFDIEEVTYTIVDNGPKTDGNKNGRVNNLTLGENRNNGNLGIVERKVNAIFKGILFDAGNEFTIRETGVLSLVDSRYGTSSDRNTVYDTFIFNKGTVNIKSGTYNGCGLFNSSASVGEFNIGDTSSSTPLNMYGVIIDNNKTMNITTGTFTDKDNSGYTYNFINNGINGTLNITGGTYTLSKYDFIYNEGIVTLEGTSTTPITVNSSTRLFNQTLGTITINNGTYKTTTSEEAFNFSGNQTMIYGGTIEAKNATNGTIGGTGTFIFGDNTVSATSTTPTIDMPNGIIDLTRNLFFNSGIMNLHRRFNRFSYLPIPRSGYYLNYTPVNDSYYKVSLSTTDTESTNPQYITGDAPEYIVTFDTAGGSGDTPSQKIVKGNTVTRPDDPIKNGYMFKGWYLQDSVYNFSTPVTDDIDLVAHWAKYYTVTLNPNGGVLADEYKTIKAVENEPLPTENLYQPYRKDYSFAGWYTEVNLQNEYDLSTPVTSDFTLYAKWYKQYDWNKDNNFTIEDIGYYRYYLAGNEMEVNGKKYEDLDYYEKLALNSNWDTNVNIIDLVHARAALADKEQV